MKFLIIIKSHDVRYERERMVVRAVPKAKIKFVVSIREDFGQI